jgi:hypothetical protein
VSGAVIAHLREIAAAEPVQFCAPAMDGTLPAELSVTVVAPGSNTSSMVKRASQTLLQSLQASRASVAAAAAAAAGSPACAAAAAAAAAAASAAATSAGTAAAASAVTAGTLAACGNARAW